MGAGGPDSQPSRPPASSAGKGPIEIEVVVVGIARFPDGRAIRIEHDSVDEAYRVLGILVRREAAGGHHA